MADHDDVVSPWQRDDWGSIDGASSESLTEPVDRDDQSRRPSSVRVWIAAGVGAVLVVSGVVALSDTTDRQGLGSANSIPASVVSTVGAPSTTAAPSVGGGVPVFWNGGELETSDTLVDERLAMAVSSVDELPVLNTWSLDVPAPLDVATEPTEVVAFGSDGILYRIAFPSGQLRAMWMSGWDDGSAQAVVGEGAIVVFTSAEVTIVRDDEPIVRVPMRGGVTFVEAWPGTDRFIVTTPSPAGGEQQLTLELDGTLAPIDSDSADWSMFPARSFLPDGRVVVNRPGGVYAVGIDQPATRLSDGDLLAAGAAHYAVDECDEALRCATFMIDVATGERTEAMLDALRDNSGFVDPSARVSPDGRTIVFANPISGTRQFLDAATGATLDIDIGGDGGPFPASWASDSSGVFSEASGSIVFHLRDTGRRVALDGIDGIRSVDARRTASGG